MIISEERIKQIIQETGERLEDQIGVSWNNGLNIDNLCFQVALNVLREEDRLREHYAKPSD